MGTCRESPCLQPDLWPAPQAGGWRAGLGCRGQAAGPGCRPGGCPVLLRGGVEGREGTDAPPAPAPLSGRARWAGSPLQICRSAAWWRESGGGQEAGQHLPRSRRQGEGGQARRIHPRRSGSVRRRREILEPRREVRGR